jgi:CPA1 family monovalent cation:H+ antiporter
VVVVLVRLLWLLPATWLTQRLPARRDHDEDIPTSRRESVVVRWAETRGVASATPALAIPLPTHDGAAFPNRGEIVFVAFMATPLVQG